MDKILQYQKIDNEIRKLEREGQNSEERIVMNKMIAFVKEAQNKSNILETKGAKLVEEYNSIKKNYDNIYKKITALTSQTEVEDFKTAFSDVNTYSSQLFMIERNLNIVINKAKELLKEFEHTKNNVLKARTKHKESKDRYEKKLGEVAPKIETLKKQLRELEKDVNPNLLEKYKSIKNDNIFPVFVPVVNKTCSGCRMELASSSLNKLSSEKLITCEHCGRIIFNK